MHEKKREFKRRHAGRIAGAGLVLLLILASVLRLEGGERNAADREARLAYIASLGWETEPDSETETSVTIPDCSEGAMKDYNELMRKADYDLSPYAGKSVVRYQYLLTNYPDCTDQVYLTLYVRHGRVIGGDIHTAALDGFMHELRARE